MPENIAQLEFFLCEFDSLEDIVGETVSRARDGKRVKLVVRILDMHGTLTEHVRMMQALEMRSEAFYRCLPADFLQRPFWERWFIERRRRRVAAKSLDAKRKLVELGVGALRETIKREGPIGIEAYPEAPFRLARHNELHELLETAGHAKSAWAFIFKPNELLADRNTIVARAF